MIKADLQKKIAEVLGVSSSEKELAFDIFISKITDLLTNNITIKVPQIGFFQLRYDPENDEATSLIYSPLMEDFSKETRSLYLNIELPSKMKILKDADSNIFSIGIDKPLLPLTDDVSSYTESETSYAILRKSIDERVNEIIVESEFLPGFNIWDDYYRSLENVEPERESIHRLSELTSDLEFKDDIIADDITSNLLDMESQTVEDSDHEKEDQSQISPSDLLEDYQPKIEVEDIVESDVELEQLIEESPGEEVKETETFQDKETTKDLESLLKGYDDILRSEIESESEDELENSIAEKKEEGRESDTADRAELEELLEDDEETYLGLKKHIDETVDWDWGDELKEEFGTGILTTEGPIFDFVEDGEEQLEETTTSSEIFRSTKPIASHLFAQLETNIKNEFKEAEKDIQYMDYYGPPPRYEFVEDRAQQVNDIYEGPYRSTGYSTYEERYRPDNKDVKDNYFGKTFILIFSAFVIVISIIVYMIMTRDSGNTTDQQSENLQALDSTANQNIIASVPADTQSNFYFEENNFPRVATLPVNDNNAKSNQAVNTPPLQQPNANASRTNTNNPLYKSAAVDTKVGKTVYFDGTSYNVQVSSWRNKSKAEQEVLRLRNLGRDAFLLEAYLPQKGGMWYRIRIGNFKSQEEAERFAIQKNY